MEKSVVFLSGNKMGFLESLWGDEFEIRLNSIGLTTRMTLAYIEANYHKQLTREKIAKFLEVTPDYLSRLFQRECGVRLMMYIAVYRIYHGQQYLVRNPRMKVKDISLDVGIADVDYFCKIFKRHTGFTPKEFRIKQLFDT